MVKRPKVFDASVLSCPRLRHNLKVLLTSRSTTFGCLNCNSRSCRVLRAALHKEGKATDDKVMPANISRKYLITVERRSRRQLGVWQPPNKLFLCFGAKMWHILCSESLSERA